MCIKTMNTKSVILGGAAPPKFHVARVGYGVSRSTTVEVLVVPADSTTCTFPSIDWHPESQNVQLCTTSPSHNRSKYPLETTY
jgi:hypothetical protein